MRRSTFTPVQWLVLVLLAANCALLPAIGLLFWNAPRPGAPLPLAPLITITRPPASSTLPASVTPTVTSTSSATSSPSHTPTVTPSRTATPTATATSTSTPTATPTPTVTPTPLWPTAVPAAWQPSLGPAGAPAPNLADFWDGRAVWQLEHADVGLPVGESDTLIGPDGQLWSFLHASWDSRAIRDQWGAEVPFPGCVTLWQSADRGASFRPFAPHCLIACRGEPCTAAADDIDQQQYPRVARSADGLWVMVYEWRAQVYLRTSDDGLNWGLSRHVPGTGVWPARQVGCADYERIGPHPFALPDAVPVCLAGAPPGVYIEDDQLYVFVGLGQNPGHLGCLTGPLADGAAGLRHCANNPLFRGAASYGPQESTGPDANAYFDFRTVSSADVLRLGGRYYMAYEGVRGPGPGAPGDSQFGLGLARSQTPAIDGPWEKYPGNPLLASLPGNVGIGHADLIVLDGVTYLYTATSERTRGRYLLVWR